MRKLMETIEQINEGKDSAALNVVNAKFAQLFEDLVELANNASAERILHPAELLNSLHALIRKHDRKLQLTKDIDEDEDSAMDGYTDRQGFTQFLIDFDAQLDSVLQAAWVEAEDEYGIEGNLDPVSEGKMEDIVSAYCQMQHV